MVVPIPSGIDDGLPAIGLIIRWSRPLSGAVRDKTSMRGSAVNGSGREIPSTQDGQSTDASRHLREW